MRILGISGSIRKASYNTQILKFVGNHISQAHESVKFEIADISDLPLYNEDIEANGGTTPSAVARLREQVRGSDAVFFATPEHNYSIPAALKNALDWLSRPWGMNALENKPGAIISSSMGYLGGIKAQYALRQVFLALNVNLVTKHEVVVPVAHQNLTAENDIKDEFIAKAVRGLVDALIVHTNNQAKK
jgi:chromate reductase